VATFGEALQWARQLLGAGDHARAEVVYRRLVEAEPAAADPWHELGVLLLQVDRPAEAVASLRRATELDPSAVAYHINLAAAYRMLKRPQDAITSFERCLTLGPPTPELLNNLALAQKDVGNHDAALRLFKQALQLRPDYANGHFNRGNLLFEMGRLDEAAASYLDAVALRPNDAFAVCKLGTVYCEQARARSTPAGAAEGTRKIETLQARQEKLTQAADCFRHALAISAEYAEARQNLAIVEAEQQQLRAQGAASQQIADSALAEIDPLIHDFDIDSPLEQADPLDHTDLPLRPLTIVSEPAPVIEAIDTEIPVAEAAPIDIEPAILNLPVPEIVAPELAALPESVAPTEQVVVSEVVVLPEPVALQEIVMAPELVAAPEPVFVPEPVAVFEAPPAVVKRQPDSIATADRAQALANQASALRAVGQLDEAAACCRRALELNPNLADAHMNLAIIAEAHGDADQAIACYRRAIDAWPDFVEAHHNLGGALAKQGRHEEALLHFCRALEKRPDFATTRSNALLALQYQDGVTLSQLGEAHRQYELRHAAPFRTAWRPHENSRSPERKLRLGFVSADLCFHPVGVFLVRALENLDPIQAETICYSDGDREDAMTNRLRAAANGWRDVRALSDDQLTEQLRADEIDVAFDLAGHSGRNRLLMFARRPAPVQVTWIGYVGTTGLRSIDYLMADRFEVPEWAEPYLTERVLRLPDDYICYDAPPDAPPCNSLPARERGYVTFGSLNNFSKITPAVVALWSDILRRVIGSRLLLKYSGLDAPSVARRVLDQFTAHGIDSSRIDLRGGGNHEEFLRGYHDIDIALDPFPYSGGLTTCEALWMGVPVVTHPGETFAGRHALTHLSNAGLTETIADSFERYVEIAVALANDLPRLASLRSTLREQVTASPLCDGQRFAVNLLRVLRGAWRQWCSSERAN
jgi:predicted O-linked N-acetylglucosamine transferase (SPINDLY family)